MVDITWEINGRKVTASSFRNEIEKAIMKNVEENIIKRVGACRCKIHNQSPRIIAKGKSIDKLTFTISGCCDELINEVKRKIN